MKTRLLLFGFLCCVGVGYAQVPVTNVIFEYASTTRGTSYTHAGVNYRFGNHSGTNRNMQNAIGIVFSSAAFYYNQFVTGYVRVRRVDNPVVSGNRSLVWMEGRENGSNLSVNLPYQDSMEVFLSGRSINRGTDNLFGNQGDGAGNNNNIERVDWIAPTGMKSNVVDESGFAIFERGADNQHDPFCIAAILALDSAGNPAQYGPVVRVRSTHYGNIPDSDVTYAIMRKEQGEQRLYRSATGTQKRGGVLVTLQSLGVAAGQTVFGYSLFGNDLPAGATPGNLLDYTNPTYFPRNTSSYTGDGGIDLIAVTGLFNTSTSTITLPVVLKDWKVQRQGAVNFLQWQLHNRSQCSDISVERSADGRQWHRLASLPSDRQEYTDGYPLRRGYYRLKMQERDGSVQYSAVIMTDTPPAADRARLEVKRQANGLEIRFADTRSQPAVIRLTALNGSSLWQQVLHTKAGLNRVIVPIPAGAGAVVVSVSSEDYQLHQKHLLR